MLTPRVHDVLIVGGGNGGLSAAAHLQRRGCVDVAIVEPATQHVYKPLQNYVGAGLAPMSSLSRSQERLTPDGVRWYRASATAVDGARRAVTLDDGTEVRGKDVLLAPGARIDWDRLPGAQAALRDGVACTTFDVAHLERTWDRIRTLRSGRAAFTFHEQPASGRETALKPLFLACDHWRREGVLGDVAVTLVHDGDRLHPVDAIDAELRRHIDAYGIDLHLSTSVLEVIDGTDVVLQSAAGVERERVDLLHLLPPYAAPEWVATSGLDAPGTDGFIAVDPETLRHPTHDRIWAVGDAADLGDGRTGGALRKQVAIAVENIRRARSGTELQRYDGYTVAPVTTSRRSLSFGEYDRSLAPRHSLPLPSALEIRSSPLWYLFDRYGLPLTYWHRILKGRL